MITSHEINSKIRGLSLKVGTGPEEEVDLDTSVDLEHVLLTITRTLANGRKQQIRMRLDADTAQHLSFSIGQVKQIVNKSRRVSR